MPSMVTLLNEELTERGFSPDAPLPKKVLAACVEEAYRRAADVEDDKLARYGRMYREIEAVAGEIIGAASNERGSKSRVESILSFHGII